MTDPKDEREALRPDNTPRILLRFEHGKPVLSDLKDGTEYIRADLATRGDSAEATMWQREAEARSEALVAANLEIAALRSGFERGGGAAMREAAAVACEEASRHLSDPFDIMRHQQMADRIRALPAPEPVAVTEAKLDAAMVAMIRADPMPTLGDQRRAMRLALEGRRAGDAVSDLEPMPYAAGMRWWLFSYTREDGGRYSAEVPAMTREDAERIAAETWGDATFDGELFGTIQQGRNDDE